MVDVEKHYESFQKIIEKYGLKEEHKAEEIAKFLTSEGDEPVSASEFAKLFNMEEEDAVIFLSFLHRGIKFKEKHLDKE